jgi:hypothetical protein
VSRPRAATSNSSPRVLRGRRRHVALAAF